ncbi:MAG: hypothetical protein M1828_000546 [Chrysothrix sp. TS-e1954]|nr:MAG: hypothetical protein M1828_000546 [Chrysothrix sp. TS-e1954]
MGIKGISHEIGPGERIALSKLAVRTFEERGRPLRLAIDISIWLFQIQSGKGGSNPALRTFYYRLLRLVSLSIHPLFVFDGPNKPPFKRNKRTGPNIASIPEFLAKQLLKQFGLPFHLAPGEAEAECAVLQKAGVVDAVLSEDVDTLMFGSALTLRNWSPEGSLKTKIPTHVNVHNSDLIKNGRSGLEPDGMILVALMSGGDYVPEGIPGCGPKTACEAARGGFGRDLCRLAKTDEQGIAKWKERLCHELKTNENKTFKAKHKSLAIPEDFPRIDILGYYTRPAVSNHDRVERLRQTLKWDEPIDIAALRTFVADAFDWTYLSGAKKFVRNLAPALLVRELRLRGESRDLTSDDTYDVAVQEGRLVKHILSKRTHVTTDSMPELRISFTPMNLVDINLGDEEPDPILPDDEVDSEEEEGQPAVDDPNEPSSPRKKRNPSNYDPCNDEKIWILEYFVKIGVPLKSEDWEESFRNARKYEALKAARQEAARAKKKAPNGGMQRGALDAFAKVAKPGISSAAARAMTKTPEPFVMDLSRSSPLKPDSQVPSTTSATSTVPPPKPTAKRKATAQALSTQRIHEEPCKQTVATLDLSTTPTSHPNITHRPFRRNYSETSTLSTHLSAHRFNEPPRELPSVLQRTSTSASLTCTQLDTVQNAARPRSPLRRTQPLPNATISPDSSPALPPPKRPTLFRQPPASPHQRILQPEPTTPTPKRNARQSASNIVAITSSPAARTPRTAPRQQSLIPFLSTDSTPRRITTPLVSSGPPIPFRLSTAKKASTVATANQALKSLQTPVRRHEMVRLRDSCGGTWKVEEMGAETVQRGRQVGRGGRIWRRSGIEIVDLSGLQ